MGICGSSTNEVYNNLNAFINSQYYSPLKKYSIIVLTGAADIFHDINSSTDKTKFSRRWVTDINYFWKSLKTLKMIKFVLNASGEHISLISFHLRKIFNSNKL
jgi:hypothetical protein